MPALHAIGTAVLQRRTEMSLTQEALAQICGLPLSTVVAVEEHSIDNLSLAETQKLLEPIGLAMSALIASSKGHGRGPVRTALERAAATASTSYRTALSAQQLEAALQAGSAPTTIAPHLAALLDEAPMSLLAKVVEELHIGHGLERAHVWSQMRRIARELQCFRQVWR